jgi:hypothetical protein
MATTRQGSSVPITEVDTWLSPHEVAEILGVAISTLAAWRTTRRRPLRFSRVSAQIVRYSLRDVQAFLRNRAVSPKSKRRT